MQSIEVTQLPSDPENYLFNVKVGDFKYTVSFSEDYYRRLTDGQVTPAELVKKSFEFLLSHESPVSILKQFDLSVISHYFSDYESAIRET